MALKENQPEELDYLLCSRCLTPACAGMTFDELPDEEKEEKLDSRLRGAEFPLEPQEE